MYGHDENLMIDKFVKENNQNNYVVKLIHKLSLQQYIYVKNNEMREKLVEENNCCQIHKLSL